MNSSSGRTGERPEDGWEERNGQAIESRWLGRRGRRIEIPGVKWPAGTEVTLTRLLVPDGRSGRCFVRLGGLVQFIEEFYAARPSRHDYILDLAVTVRPAEPGYPLTANRQAFSGEAASSFRAVRQGVEEELQADESKKDEQEWEMFSVGPDGRIDDGAVAALDRDQSPDDLLSDGLRGALTEIEEIVARTRCENPLPEVPPIAVSEGEFEVVQRAHEESRCSGRGGPATVEAVEKMPFRIVGESGKDLGITTLRAVREGERGEEGIPTLTPPKRVSGNLAGLSGVPGLGFEYVISRNSKDWPRRRKLDFRKIGPSLVAWDASVRLVAKCAGIGEHILTGLVLSKGRDAQKERRNGVLTVLANPDWLVRVTRKRDSLAAAAVLRDAICHELAHRRHGDHDEEFSRERELLGQHSAGSLPDLARIVEIVTGRARRDDDRPRELTRRLEELKDRVRELWARFRTGQQVIDRVHRILV
ncbi:MAG: hypothetical protein HY720_14360 [Planctomycetes bacterium]|nr:hypothetical protein [Planctomycetota bacterium]